MSIKIFRNRPTMVYGRKSVIRWRIEHLPVKQTLVFAGPVFILIQR